MPPQGQPYPPQGYPQQQVSPPMPPQGQQGMPQQGQIVQPSQAYPDHLPGEGDEEIQQAKDDKSLYPNNVQPKTPTPKEQTKGINNKYN